MKKLIFFLAFFPVFSSLVAQQLPERPSPPRLVNDFAKMLSAGEANTLENKLVSFNDSTSTQIAVVIVETLEGYDISDYSFKLGEKWGVGQANKDNGVLILVSKSEREVFIATGYGVEQYVTDALSKRIVNNTIIPRFKEGNYYEGLNDATDIIIGLTTGAFVADKTTSRENKSLPVPLVVILIIAVIILMKIFGRGGGGGFGRNIGRTFGGPRHFGGFGNFSSGRGSFGGGGFGGFGGGSFGGGGAGGKW
jgi:uncharacterized protein